MRRVHGPLADPYRTGHERPLELPVNSSLKQPWLAARAWVAWRASPLLPAEGRRGSNESRGPPERLHASRGSGAPRAPRLRPHPRMNWLPTIVKSHVFNEPPALTRACQIAQQNHGLLYQHEKRRGRLKGTPGPAEKEAGQSPQSINHAGRHL